jgi:hypothetical protein
MLQFKLFSSTNKLSVKKNTCLYYECHVTVDPVGDEAEALRLQIIAKNHDFRVAKLLMSKAGVMTVSTLDAFLTGRAGPREFNSLLNRMTSLCKELQQNGHNVRRYKIEAATLDSKVQGDLLKLCQK